MTDEEILRATDKFDAPKKQHSADLAYIPIALTDSDFGEQAAQACAIACFVNGRPVPSTGTEAIRFFASLHPIACCNIALSQ